MYNIYSKKILNFIYLLLIFIKITFYKNFNKIFFTILFKYIKINQKNFDKFYVVLFLKRTLMEYFFWNWSSWVDFKKLFSAHAKK
jgi:hypothetical protein